MEQLRSVRTMIRPENGQTHSSGHSRIQSLVTNPTLRLVGSPLLIFIFKSNQLLQPLKRRLKSQPLNCQHFAPLPSLPETELALGSPDDPASSSTSSMSS